MIINIPSQRSMLTVLILKKEKLRKSTGTFILLEISEHIHCIPCWAKPGLLSLQNRLTHVHVSRKAPEINLSANSKWKAYAILTWKNILKALNQNSYRRKTKSYQLFLLFRISYMQANCLLLCFWFLSTISLYYSLPISWIICFVLKPILSTWSCQYVPGFRVI